MVFLRVVFVATCLLANQLNGQVLVQPKLAKPRLGTPAQAPSNKNDPETLALAQGRRILEKARLAKGGGALKQIRQIRYQAAHKTALNSFNKTISSSKFDIALSYTGAFRSHVTNEAGEQQQILLYDGRHYWDISTDQAKEQSEEAAMRIQQVAIREWFGLTLQPLAGMTLEVKALPDLVVNEKLADTISVNSGPARFIACFDKQTHLQVKQVFSLELTDTVLIEDYPAIYRVGGGIKLAHQYTGHANGELDGTILVKSYQVSRHVEPRLFTKP